MTLYLLQGVCCICLFIPWRFRNELSGQFSSTAFQLFFSQILLDWYHLRTKVVVVLLQQTFPWVVHAYSAHWLVVYHIYLWDWWQRGCHQDTTVCSKSGQVNGAKRPWLLFLSSEGVAWDDGRCITVDDGLLSYHPHEPLVQDYLSRHMITSSVCPDMWLGLLTHCSIPSDSSI